MKTHKSQNNEGTDRKPWEKDRPRGGKPHKGNWSGGKGGNRGGQGGNTGKPWLNKSADTDGPFYI